MNRILLMCFLLLVSCLPIENLSLYERISAYCYDLRYDIYSCLSLNKNNCLYFTLPIPEECYVKSPGYEWYCCESMEKFYEECEDKREKPGTYINCVIEGGYDCEEDEDGIFRFKTKRDCTPYIGK